MLTDRQLRKKPESIGGSEVAAAIGLHPLESPYDVWLRKTGRCLPKPEIKTTQAGKRFEAGVLAYAEEQLGKLTRVGTERRIKGTPVLVHCDAIVRETGEPVEAKVTGLLSGWPQILSTLWGAEGTDNMPEPIVIQGLIEAYACDASVCHTPVFITGRGFVMFEVRVPASNLIKEILEIVNRFWTDHVLADKPPTDARPSMDSLKRRIRIPAKTIVADTDESRNRCAAYLYARNRRLLAEKEESMAKRDLLTWLDDAEAIQHDAIVLPDGSEIAGGLITNFEYHRKAHEVSATTYRQLKTKEIGNA